MGTAFTLLPPGPHIFITRLRNIVFLIHRFSTQVWHHMCHGHKPKIQEQCNTQPCYSEWATGEWSKVSVKEYYVVFSADNVLCRSRNVSPAQRDSAPSNSPFPPSPAVILTLLMMVNTVLCSPFWCTIVKTYDC